VGIIASFLVSPHFRLNRELREYQQAVQTDSALASTTKSSVCQFGNGDLRDRVFRLPD
jgi:hypothetical protein